MLNWLTKLFGGGAPRARKMLDLDARLSAADPASPLHGEAEYEAWEDGSWQFEVEVEGPDGTTAPAGLVAMINGAEVGALSPRGDEAELKLSQRRGDTLAVFPEVGSTIEVRDASGAVLVSGMFQPDR